MRIKNLKVATVVMVATTQIGFIAQGQEEIIIRPHKTESSPASENAQKPAATKQSETKELKDSKDTKVVSTPVPFETQYVFSRDVGAGRIVRSQEGKNGSVKKIYKLIRNEKGDVVKKELISTEKIPATPQINKIGKSGWSTSRGSFSGRKVMTMNSTSYMPMDGIPKGQKPLAKMGMLCKFGAIAVDPRVIPLGTYLYVEGYGFGYACDTGGAIKGNIIDVCYESRSQMNNWGRRKVKVHILSTDR